MLNAQQRQKRYCDNMQVPSVFEVGPQVLLPTTNLHFQDIGPRKLIPKWVESFTFTARLGPKVTPLWARESILIEIESRHCKLVSTAHSHQLDAVGVS